MRTYRHPGIGGSTLVCRVFGSSRWEAVIAAATLVLAVILVSCGPSGRPKAEFETELGDDGQLVVVTTSIWADVVANLLCEPREAVTPVIPAGGDPHGFQPSLAHAGAISEADLVVANGGGLEGSMVDLLEDRELKGGAVVYATELTATDPVNPHIWLDPRRVVEVSNALAPVLIEAGADPSTVEQCTDEYVAELEGLDRQIAQQLANLAPADRKLVTNHDALGYFADRYEFEVIGTLLSSSSTLTEAGPGDFEQLRSLINEHGVRAVFAEGGHSTAEMETLVSQLDGVRVVELDLESLGEPESATGTYLDMMRVGSEQIAVALEAKT